MKSLKKALVCISLVCCLSVGAIGCSSSDSDGDTSQTDADASVSVSDGNAEVTDAENQETDEQGNVVTNADSTSSDDDSDSDSNNDGDSTTQETVALTDSEGNVVTDDDGNVVTQIVVNSNNSSTTTSSNGQTTDSDGNVVTNNNSNSNNDGDSDSDSNSDDNNDSSIYFAKNRYSTFIWMSEDTSNRYESGIMAEIAVKVLDDATAGDYSMEFNYVELYDTNGEEVPFTVQNSTITVGKASSVSEQGAATSGVNYRLDNATAQPGDVVKIKVHLDNNSGIAVTRVELKYDNKALEIQSISASGAFSDQIIESALNLESSIS